MPEDPSIARRLSSRLRSSDPLIAEIIEWIPYMPIRLRKTLLSCCQMGIGIDGHWRITSEITSFYETFDIPFHPHTQQSLHRHVLSRCVREMVSSHVLRSFFSMLLRCETNHVDDGSDLIAAGIDKEVHASLNTFSEVQLLNYSSLFGRKPSDWCPETPLTPSWASNARLFAKRLESNLEKLVRENVFFPDVQRRKNMSRETCTLLHLDGYSRDDRRIEDFGTVDLERHYYWTGRRVLGSMEMRWAWKFNDLKPRVYYCVGGYTYWSSRYMKKIAVVFMNSWPPTHVRRRGDPAQISNWISSDEFVVIWDYESFTSNLSELRYFLYWVARYIEDSPTLRQYPARLFDYRTGMTTKPLWELIDEYNEECNVFAEYSLHRVVDACGLLTDSLSRHHRNSGALGVKANIGLSTSLHGLHASVPAVSKDSVVCVGDDAKAGVKEPPEEGFIPHLQRLGRLVPEKVEIFPPVHEGDSHIWKFVKRSLTRTYHGLFLDHMYDFPILALVLGRIPKNRTVRLPDKETLLHQICHSVGALLWQIHSSFHEYTQDEDRLLKKILRWVYYRLQLPCSGALPGRIIDGIQLHVCIPPLEEDFDPSEEDWSEYLWNHHSGSFFSIPWKSDSAIAPERFYHTGQTFVATGHSILNILEDLGKLKQVRRLWVTLRSEEENYRVFKQSLQNTGYPMIEYVYVDQMPEYYDDCFDAIFSFLAVPSYGLFIEDCF